MSEINIKEMGNTMVLIKKTVPGTLVFPLQDAEIFGNERSISIDASQEFTRVPLKFAASMFQISGTYNLYQKGYFTFEQKDKELIFKYARALGFYFGDDDSGKDATYEQPEKLYSEAQIRNFVLSGREQLVEEILESGYIPQIELLMDVARENSSKITVGVIDLIEQKTGVEILEGDR